MSYDRYNPASRITSSDEALIAAALSHSENTPEEERRELEAFMDAAYADLDATLPPYDWG